MAGAARKRQTAQVTVEFIALYGVQAATVSQIAERPGVSEPALYRHFENRHHMPLAALDLVFELISDLFVSWQGYSAPE